MRVELNLPALERLLGGDTEIEIHLRRQIVEEFARKNLKTLLNDSSWNKVYAVWKAEVDGLIKEHLATLLAERESATVTASSFRWQLDEAIHKAAQTAVDDAVQVVLESHKNYYLRHIKDQVNAAIGKEINKQVEAEIQRRLTAAKEMTTP